MDIIDIGVVDEMFEGMKADEEMRLRIKKLIALLIHRTKAYLKEEQIVEVSTEQGKWRVFWEGGQLHIVFGWESLCFYSTKNEVHLRCASYKGVMWVYQSLPALFSKLFYISPELSGDVEQLREIARYWR